MTIGNIKRNAGDNYFSDFVMTMSNIRFQLHNVPSTHGSNLDNLIGVSRSLSVELRKLLLDKSLLSSCLYRPQLHPLINPKRLKGDQYEDTFEIRDASLNLTRLDGPTAGATALIPIEDMRHTTVIKPLYGLCFRKDTDQWVTESPFDKNHSPVKLDKWLKQSVIQIDENTYNMRKVLAEVANTQGAHSDHINDIIRKQINRNFQSHYLNIFILVVAIYVYNQFCISAEPNEYFRKRVTKLHPSLKFENNRFDFRIEFPKDVFLAKHQELILRPKGVIQQTNIVSGVPEIESQDQLVGKPIHTQSIIRIPSK